MNPDGRSVPHESANGHVTGKALLSRVWNPSAVTAAQKVVAAAITPLDDQRGSAAYRLALSQSLIEKFWWETREAQAA